MAHPDTDLVGFELEKILALSDLEISYSYSDDSTGAKPIPLKAIIARDELWKTISTGNVSMSLRAYNRKKSGIDETPWIITAC